jgi:hypothetical protein
MTGEQQQPPEQQDNTARSEGDELGRWQEQLSEKIQRHFEKLYGGSK